VPISVGKPHRISFYSIPILVAVPTIVSMGPVLNIENGMAKAGLAKSRVPWLWLCHAAPQRNVFSFLRPRNEGMHVDGKQFYDRNKALLGG